MDSKEDKTEDKTEDMNQLNDTKTILNALVIPNVNGVSLKTLCDDYFDLEGQEIPYKQFGFNTLMSFLKSMPDMIRIAGRPEDGPQWVTLFPIVTEATEHIIEMVSNQSNKRKNSKKSVKRKSCSDFWSPKLIGMKKRMIGVKTPTKSLPINQFIRSANRLSHSTPKQPIRRPERALSEPNPRPIQRLTNGHQFQSPQVCRPSVPVQSTPVRPLQWLPPTPDLPVPQTLYSSPMKTLNDWIRQKKDVLRPEIRINKFKTEAKQSVRDEDFEEAVVHYSKAIELSPNDYSLYRRRSFCYEILNNFEMSLSDAQKAIEISEQMLVKKNKESEKYRNKSIYWRKAVALRAMKRFQESIDALVFAKSLAIRCQFIDNEIKDIKLEVMCDLGYDRSDVQSICDSFDSIDHLVKQLNENKRSLIDSTDNSDQLPTNPFKYRGLYINGLVTGLEEEQLENLLSNCGPIIRCKVYSNSQQSRAIVTFLEEQSVREAIKTIRSNKELIRDQSVDNLVIRYRHTCVEGGTDPQSKFKGTEIAGECYKWRTTDCTDGTDCKALHIPICHHLDSQSIETECVKRKRTPIVFDIDSTVTPIKKVMNGFDSKSSSKTKVFSSDTPVIRLSPKSSKSESNPQEVNNSVRKVITFDLNSEPNELSPIKANKILGISDRKRISFGSKSDSNSNQLNSTPDSTKKVRNKIVFDLKSDSDSNDKSFTVIKPKAPQLSTSSDRAVTSYEDLF